MSDMSVTEETSQELRGLPLKEVALSEHVGHVCDYGLRSGVSVAL